METHRGVEGSEKYVTYLDAINKMESVLCRWNVAGLSDEEQEKLAAELTHLKETLVCDYFVVSDFGTEELHWKVYDDGSRRYCAVAKE